jgi:hypothetical protein
MPKNVPPFEVTCPCCNAVLKVDAEIQGVIAHTVAVKPRMFADIEEAARAMKEQDTRRDSIFRQSVEAQKHASDLLEKKFQEAVKKAKESPDTGKPIRDFDLD